ncbi:SusC/RagA family TonB-linked outer membrane protein [Mucilaginibacter glaciei]|uniref:TonB-dependent receptor n=1 Tax=Mucilaginibacter glaciei TaxID=2772109 RepID=A0A926NX21_9SPHI|nr:TonB-dependent receptor [Mucilaginibacter glaciei]MBD1393403.1 TonB-dependent receptor [Mucilaginibacter glaciei]
MSKLRLNYLGGKLLCGILSLLTLLCFSQVQGQSLVRGVVKDAKGVSIPGVTVLVKGTTVSTATNVEGKFSITAGNSSVLKISMVGFDPQEVTVSGQQQISIVLKESNQNLQEVVVIGYGTKKKIDLTGTVNSLQADEIVKARATGTQEAMQGRLPGVDIKRSSGKPGSDFSIEIRGANSITGSTQPLYVIDGIAVAQNGSATNPVNDLNPADIERIDVLKDASSTAIYGSRGANGVVLVTTKRGSKGSVKIVYDGYTGIVNPYNLPPDMDGPTFVNYARDYYNELAQATAIRNGTPLPTTPVTDDKIFSATELSNIAAGKYTNWINLIKRNGVSSNHNLSVSGGDEKTTYFVGAGYQLYQGTVQGESTKKYTLKAGLDKNINNTFKVGASVYSTFADIRPGSGEIFRSAYRLRPTGSAYDAAGNKRFFTYEGETQITNPLFEPENEIRQQQYLHVLPNIYGEANVIKGLKLRSSFSPDITFQRQGQYNDMLSKQQLGTRPNSASTSSNQWVNYTWDNLITYNNEFGKHKFDVTLGNTFEYHQQDFSSNSVQGLPFRSLWYNLQSATTVNGIAPIISVGSGYSKQTIASFYGRANYTFNNRYLLTGTIRTDVNSLFAPGKQRGWFPSAAAAWIVSEEEFVKDIRAINLLKLRLSYGKSGNAAISAFLQPYGTQSTLNQTLYDFNGAGANGFSPNFGNQNLTWEKTDEYNLGLDMQLFNSRIGLQLDLYSKKSKGSILSQQIPAANGYNATTTNLGSVGNKGIEVGLNTVNVRTSKFSWTTNINFSANQNRILELYGDGKDDIGNARFIGQKARVVYRYKIIGVWQNEEADQAKAFNRIPGQYKIQDFSGPAGVPDGKIDSYDRQILGSDIPNWFGGLTNTINFANVDFSFTLYTRQGTFQNSVFLEQVMNGDQGRARFGAFDRNYWTPTNPSNTWANTARETDGDARTAAQFQNTSYTKISNITLGYTVPKNLLNKVKIAGLRVYVNAFNPFVFTKFVGWDPENPDGSSFLNQDFRTRTFILGVNLTL